MFVTTTYKSEEVDRIQFLMLSNCVCFTSSVGIFTLLYRS